MSDKMDQVMLGEVRMGLFLGSLAVPYAEETQVRHPDKAAGEQHWCYEHNGGDPYWVAELDSKISEEKLEKYATAINAGLKVSPMMIAAGEVPTLVFRAADMPQGDFIKHIRAANHQLRQDGLAEQVAFNEAPKTELQTAMVALNQLDIKYSQRHWDFAEGRNGMPDTVRLYLDNDAGVGAVLKVAGTLASAGIEGVDCSETSRERCPVVYIPVDNLSSITPEVIDKAQEGLKGNKSSTPEGQERKREGGVAKMLRRLDRVSKMKL